MQMFTDALGRQWEIVIDLSAIRRVKAALDLALPSLYEDELKPLIALVDDPLEVADAA